MESIFLNILYGAIKNKEIKIDGKSAFYCNMIRKRKMIFSLTTQIKTHLMFSELEIDKVQTRLTLSASEEKFLQD